jgi:hypothetical protein
MFQLPAQQVCNTSVLENAGVKFAKPRSEETHDFGYYELPTSSSMKGRFR